MLSSFLCLSCGLICTNASFTEPCGEPNRTDGLGAVGSIDPTQWWGEFFHDGNAVSVNQISSVYTSSDDLFGCDSIYDVTIASQSGLEAQRLEIPGAPSEHAGGTVGKLDEMCTVINSGSAERKRESRQSHHSLDKKSLPNRILLSLLNQVAFKMNMKCPIGGSSTGKPIYMFAVKIYEQLLVSLLSSRINIPANASLIESVQGDLERLQSSRAKGITFQGKNGDTKLLEYLICGTQSEHKKLAVEILKAVCQRITLRAIAALNFIPGVRLEQNGNITVNNMTFPEAEHIDQRGTVKRKIDEVDGDKSDTEKSTKRLRKMADEGNVENVAVSAQKFSTKKHQTMPIRLLVKFIQIMGDELDLDIGQVETRSPHSVIYDGLFSLFKELLNALLEKCDLALSRETIKKNLEKANNHIGSPDPRTLYAIICDQEYDGRNNIGCYHQCCLQLFRYALLIKPAETFKKIRLCDDGDLCIDGWYFQPYSIPSHFIPPHDPKLTQSRESNSKDANKDDKWNWHNYVISTDF